MSGTAAPWPRKTRELHNHHMDSTVWNDFSFREDDIVIATYGKAGTTWVQQIVGQLIFDGQEGVPVSVLSPWLDLRVPQKEVKLAALEQQTNRRFIKTHLPVDALLYSPRAKYLYVGRDGRDVVWSLYNHHLRANERWYQALNETPGLVGPPIAPPPDSIRQYFLEWLAGDGYPFWSFRENIRSWWEIRALPNLLLVHYEDLKRDLAGEMRRIAAFLEFTPAAERWPAIIAHCTFDYMKANAAEAAPLGGAFWEGGAETFIHKGVNGRWRETLTGADRRAYETMVEETIGTEGARWLARGRHAAMPADTPE
ncbi:MAG: sulfotransferase domain-containing protein [Rhodospirillales bacterium]|nr:sulfotransferase domain-containing protein [Rhodospirillales bacterium]